MTPRPRKRRSRRPLPYKPEGLDARRLLGLPVPWGLLALPATIMSDQMKLMLAQLMWREGANDHSFEGTVSMGRHRGKSRQVISEELGQLSAEDLIVRHPTTGVTETSINWDHPLMRKVLDADAELQRRSEQRQRPTDVPDEE